MIKIIRIWFLYLFFLPVLAFALQLTPPAFTYIKNHQFSDVRKVISGPLGFQWLATDMGVFRYDGFELQKYDLGSNLIIDATDLLFDNAGTLWVAAYGQGLYYLDKSSKKLVLADIKNEKTHDAHIYKLFIDSESALWVGHLHGIAKYNIVNSNTLESIDPLFQTTRNATVWDIYEDSKNQIWIATVQQGVFLHKLKTSKTLHLRKDNTPSLTDNIVRSIIESKSGLIWIGTDNGLTVYDPNQDKYKSYWSDKHNERTLSSNSINEIYQDDLGRIWVGTYGAGLNLYNPSSDDFQRIAGNTKYDFPAKVVNHIITDRQGSLWIGTEQGLFQSLSMAFLFKHQVLEDKNQSLTRAVFQGSGHKLWYGTEKGVIVEDIELDKSQLISPDIRDAVSFYEDEQGYIWVATLRQGLFKINKSGQIIKNFNQNNSVLPTNTLTKLLPDRKDKNIMWIGLLGADEKNNGLLKFDFTTLKFKHFAPKRFVADIVEFDEDTLIVASRSLAPAFFDKETEQFTTIEHHGDITPFIDKLYIDNKNRVWAGTFNSGLWFLNKEITKWEKVKEIMPKHIFAITQDKAGILWLTGTTNLIAYNPEEKNVLMFNAADGLKSEGYTDKGVLVADVDNHQRIYLTAHNGISYFNPIELKEHIEATVNPKPIFTQLRIANKINHAIYSNKAQKMLPFEQASEIELTHRDYLFSINFSGLDFIKPETQQFEYKLEGLDEGWLTAKADSRVATYSTLAQGNYVLKVRKAGSINEHKLKIKVLPPPWLTWPAYFIYFCFFVLFVWAIVFFKQRTLKLKARALSHAVELKTEQLQDANSQLEQKNQVIKSLLEAKNNLFTQVSHELRTPLTLVLSPINQLLAQLAKPEHISILTIANKNVLILQGLVEQLLQLAKLESQPTHEHCIYDIGESLDTILSAYAPVLNERGIQVTCSSINGVYLRLVCNSLEICVSNLLSNAIKFSPKHSKIRVSFYRNHSYFVLSITDQGCGIAESEREAIFDKFYRLNSQTNHEYINGSGIGLSIVSELMEANRGQVKVHSQYDQGSTFSLEFPITSEAKNDDLAERKKAVTIRQIKSYLPVKAEDIKTNAEQNVFQEDKLRVLIIEDNLHLRVFLKQLLESSYNCLIASDGAQGIIIAKETIPDLIITDIMMPKMNGYEVTDVLRAEQLTCHIPIIMLTAKSDTDSRQEGWRHHVDEYISKPFDNQELLLRIENLIAIRKMLRQSLGRELGANKLRAISEHKLTDLDNDFIFKFEKVIEQHFQNEAFSRSMAAFEMHISERQLNRKLAHLLDHNFSEYLRKYRLRQSLRLIDSELQVAQIAEKVGFSSASYFNQCFKAEYGNSVSQFRKNGKKRKQFN